MTNIIPGKKERNTERVNIRLTPQERERINKVSYQKNKTITQLIKEHINSL